MEELLPKMDEDSRIKRLREYIQLYLRRNLIKGDASEECRNKFLSKESTFKLRKSQDASSSKKRFNEDSKDKHSNRRNKKINRKIKEEIGRSFSTIDNNPIQGDKIFTDLKIEIYPVGQTYMASIESKDGEKVSKLFRDEESAKIWVRNNSLKLSNKFTQ